MIKHSFFNEKFCESTIIFVDVTRMYLKRPKGECWRRENTESAESKLTHGHQMDMSSFSFCSSHSSK